jgi:hypothetical protein
VDHADVTPVDKLVCRPGDTLLVRPGPGLSDFEQDQVEAKLSQQLAPLGVRVVLVNARELALIRPDRQHLAAQERVVHSREVEQLTAGSQPSEPRRNVAIRIAREWHETDVALEGAPDRLRVLWEELPAELRAHRANVVDDLIARGVIKP